MEKKHFRLMDKAGQLTPGLDNIARWTHSLKEWDSQTLDEMLSEAHSSDSSIPTTAQHGLEASAHKFLKLILHLPRRGRVLLDNIFDYRHYSKTWQNASLLSISFIVVENQRLSTLGLTQHSLSAIQTKACVHKHPSLRRKKGSKKY